MPRYFAFLRGINVGGHRITMDRLRELIEGLDVQGKRILDIGSPTRWRHSNATRRSCARPDSPTSKSPMDRNGIADECARSTRRLYPRMLELMSQQDADHFVENWRAMLVVCEKGEMIQGYCRARRPA